jgi:very-short-patch-repair endonuclease
MKRHGLKEDAIQHARTLRQTSSPVERRLWRGLRHSFPEAHFRRQVPLGVYFADFASHTYKLVLEVDGDSHAFSQAYDEQRTRFLEEQGYKVLRFWNKDVTRNLDGVLEQVRFYLDSHPLTPCRRDVSEGVATPPPPLARRLAQGKPPSSAPPHKGEGNLVVDYILSVPLS